MKKLPLWVVPDVYPARFESESATCIEMVAKLYGSMDELIDEYNQFATEINQAIDDFMAQANKNYEAFTLEVCQKMQNFIDIIELKIKEQDQTIKNRMDAQDAEITKRMNEQDAEIKDRMDAQDAVINERMDTQDAVIKERMDAQDKTINDRMDAQDETINERLTAQDNKIDERLTAQDNKIDERLENQDDVIAEAVEYMKTNIQETTLSIVEEYVNNGGLDDVLSKLTGTPDFLENDSFSKSYIKNKPYIINFGDLIQSTSDTLPKSDTMTRMLINIDFTNYDLSKIGFIVTVKDGDDNTYFTEKMIPIKTTYIEETYPYYKLEFGSVKYEDFNVSFKAIIYDSFAYFYFTEDSGVTRYYAWHIFLDVYYTENTLISQYLLGENTAKENAFLINDSGSKWKQLSTITVTKGDLIAEQLLSFSQTEATITFTLSKTGQQIIDDLDCFVLEECYPSTGEEANTFYLVPYVNDYKDVIIYLNDVSGYYLRIMIPLNSETAYLTYKGSVTYGGLYKLYEGNMSYESLVKNTDLAINNHDYGYMRTVNNEMEWTQDITLISPNGGLFKLVVDDSGNLSTETIHEMEKL